jgi:hypothetical protein
MSTESFFERPSDPTICSAAFQAFRTPAKINVIAS